MERSMLLVSRLNIRRREDLPAPRVEFGRSGSTGQRPVVRERVRRCRADCLFAGAPGPTARWSREGGDRKSAASVMSWRGRFPCGRIAPDGKPPSIRWWAWAPLRATPNQEHHGLSGAHFAAEEIPRINVNKARAIDLESGLRLRRSESAAIIEYRTKNGPFKSIEDLKKVPGIDAAKIEAKKDRLTFEDKP